MKNKFKIIILFVLIGLGFWTYLLFEKNNIKVSQNYIGKAEMVVDQDRYTREVKENQSVFGFMEELSLKENFSFKYKEYLSLGAYVEEINGKKNEGGKYWMYYVNDVEASVGVSNFIIKNGDIIRWELK